MKKHKLPYFKDRFVILFMTFVIVYILYPFFEEDRIDVILDILMTFVLLSSIYSVSEKKRDIFMALGLAIPGLAILWTYELIVSKTLATIGLGFLITFFIFSAIHILRHVINVKQVTRNTIFGALCVYVLMGLIWAVLYSLVELHYPGSFYFAHENITSHDTGRRLFSNFSPYFYFSFVTMTTLGYGDIIPVQPIARSMATLEAIIGQIYLIVLVARLVALHVAHGRIERD